MSIDVGALVLFSPRLERTVAFYRALGLPLVSERHGDGPEHWVCELGATHFAIHPAQGEGAPGYREGGASMVGLRVPSAEAAVAAAESVGATIVQRPAAYPWGIRAVLLDPDGRPVEVFEPPADG